MRRTHWALVAIAMVLASGCSDSSENDRSVNESPINPEVSDPEQRAELDAGVVRAVAPYDYGSAIDEAVVVHLLKGRTEAAMAECITAKGGVSTYEPSPPPSASTTVEEVVSGFPNMELLAERGKTLLIDPPPPGINREDFATDQEYFDAQEMALADRVPSEDEMLLSEECATETDVVEANSGYELYESVRNAWRSEQYDIETSPEVDGLRSAFLDCVVDGGMARDPSLNEVTFWAHFDAEILTRPDEGAMRSHARTLGMLYAECGAEIQEVKERIAADAHERFVAEHEEDIAQISHFLYG